MSDLVGTIKTVPKAYTDTDWIDYSEGLLISDDYPLLAGVLSSTYLGSVGTVEVGSVRVGFKPDSFGSWVEWHKVMLSQYPELEKFVWQMIMAMPVSESRTIWVDAYNRGVLPNINERFLRLGKDALFTDEKNASLYTLPVVEYTDNLLKKAGLADIEPEKETYSVTSSLVQGKSNYRADLVLLGQRPSNFKLKEEAYMSYSGDAEKTEPEGLNIQLYVNTADYIPGVPNTHKLVIKAKETLC